MEQRVDPLRELGRAVAEAQDVLLTRSAGPLGETPSAVVSRPARGQRSAWVWGGAGVALAAAAALLIVLLPSNPEPLAFFVQDQPAEVGQWIAAPSGGSLPIRFSDGTRFELQASARARVTAVTDRGASVLIERGRSHISVVHRQAGAWRVQVGPFEVEVTGTRFDVGWDSELERFELELHEGHVVVSGPMLEGRHDVRAGQSLRAELARGHVEISDSRSAARDEPTAPPPPEPAPSTPTAAEPSTATRHAADRDASWTSLARAGNYREAMKVLDAVGFDRVLDRAAPRDWALLADTARFSGRWVEAERVYHRMRERGGSLSATAAFELGRILFDRRTRYHEAAEWFATYLREAPDGPLAEDALGRLMEAQHHSGQRDEARASAERYLARYRTGTHRDFALSLLR